MRRTIRAGAVLVAAGWSCCFVAGGDLLDGVAPASLMPVWENGVLTYPEGAPLPRYATEYERSLGPIMPTMELGVEMGPPDGPIHCAAEYEPMDGILIAWEGTAGQQTILQQMAVRITNEGQAKLYVVVDTTSEQVFANNALVGAGCDMSRVEYIVRVTDSIWIRDYGPRYIFQGDCRAIVDHTYNRPRPNDDAFPPYFAQVKNHAAYQIPIIHGGGNFHLNDEDESFATRLTVNENPSLTEPQLINLWGNYQNLQHTFLPPFPTSVDATQHLDMWMQITGPRSVVISDWPNNVGSVQDNICDAQAAAMQSAGWTVTRVPARSISGTHYTYTNVVMCNDIVLLPTYTNATVVAAGHNGQALSAWQAAAPGKQIIQIDCQAIVTFAGVMHCIVMHVPEHRGGLNPTAYLRNLRGGESLNPNDVVEIRWISDDDVQVVNADILLSTDGGVTFDTVIASHTADDGTYTWTVPNIDADQARIRIVTRDADGRTGSDESPANFSINGSAALLGDMNCDGILSVADIGPFVLAMTDPAGYAAQFPNCDANNGDMNGDSQVSVSDIGLFVAALTGG